MSECECERVSERWLETERGGIGNGSAPAHDVMVNRERLPLHIFMLAISWN